jgi:type IV pilus biogenesis protein CpaD/CtpE
MAFVNALMEQRRQRMIPDDVRISDILRLEGVDHERLVTLTNEAVEHHKQRATRVLEAFDGFYESLTESQRQRVRAYVDRWQYGCHHHVCA